MHGSSRRDRDGGRGTAAGWFTQPLLPDDLLGTLNPLWSRQRAARPRRRAAPGDRRHHHPAAAHRPGAPARTGAGQFVGDRHPARRGVALAHLLGHLPARRSAAGRHRDRAARRDRLRRAGPPHPGGHAAAARPAGRRVRAARPGAGEAAVPHRRQRHHPGHGHAARAGRDRPDALAGAVLRALRPHPGRRWCSAPELRALAAATGLQLVERHTAAEGRLTPDTLADAVPDWAARQTWACGPAGLLDALAEHWARRRRPGRAARRAVRAARPGRADATGGRVRSPPAGSRPTPARAPR